MPQTPKARFVTGLWHHLVVFAGISETASKRQIAKDQFVVVANFNPFGTAKMPRDVGQIIVDLQYGFTVCMHH